MKVEIDDKIYNIESGDEDISYGDEDKVLSNENTDLCWGKPWYPEGYLICDLLDEKEFNEVYEGVENRINKISKKKFKLQDYHKHVDDKKHYEIVKKTRDLFPDDFSFCLKKNLEEKMGLKLTDRDPIFGNSVHIIVRINRPESFDYNPPHKDIYEYYDDYGIISKMVNFWIPICGVNNKSMLPVAPKSHRIPENKILRSSVGGIVNGRKYRVRNIYEWNNSIKLVRPSIRNGQVLIFTPNLIHGAAVNEQKDVTRVALEFRLYEEV